MAPDLTVPTPAADQWTSLTCILPGCGEPLAVRWELYAPLVAGELEPDADPLTPGDAVAGDWRVECLSGHVILLPGDQFCPGDGPLCSDDLCDHDHSDDLRTWRRSNVDRLAQLLDRSGPPADPSLRDRVINAISPHAEGGEDVDCPACDQAAAAADAVLAVVAEHQGQPAAAPVDPDPFDHILTFDGSGWQVDHPVDGCDRARCPMGPLAHAEVRAGKVPRGRWQAGVNDLGDRLLLGDRIDPPDRQ